MGWRPLMVRSGDARIRHWTYSRIMPFKIGYQSRFCMFLLSLTLLGRWLRRLCGSLSGGELSPGGEWGWRGSSRWEIVEKTRKNKIYLVVVVVFEDFMERQQQVGDCLENQEKWNIFYCCCRCCRFWQFYGEAGGRMWRKLGKMKYIWLLLSLWITFENFMEGQQQVGDC